jgi:predicted ATPase/DNA-binding winged helix-turn-helix (wHTH) protein
MHPVSETPLAIDFRRFRVLPHRRELLVDSRLVELGGRAFDVLVALIEARGAVVSKERLMERAWPGRIVDENNLPAQITALRKAFAADRDLIRTVPGRGYQFTGEISMVATGPDALPDARRAAPIPASSRIPTNLPESVSELIGREVELGQIVELSASQRLVTLAGAGGIGKTRLGIEVGRHLLPRFADGVWIVQLAPLSDPELVPAAVATALGLELTSGTALPVSVVDALRSKRLMLILDNCEHVVEAAAKMTEALLRTNPAALVIATSREPLRVEGEWVYVVPPLAVPPEVSSDSEDPLHYGALRLFVERARAVAPYLSPDAPVAAAIAGICRRLDGLPLAIELAAARAAALGIEELLAGLDDRFQLLAGGRRTALPRHQTLRGTLDWSYELLTEPERVVLRRLAIFAGGFTLQAAGEVVAGDEFTTIEIVDCVTSLVEKSLVTADVGGLARRYRLLETTRAYALEKLVQSGEFDTVARRHARRYLDLFEDAEVDAMTRPTEWLADYVPRIDNVRAALDWAFSPSGDASIGVALTAAAVPLWMHLSLMEECRGQVERAFATIDAGTRGDAHREMRLHAALAQSLMYGRGAVSEIRVIGTKALQIAESLDDVEYQLRSIWGLWSFHTSNGEHSVALSLAQRFHVLAAERSDPNDRLMGEKMIGVSQYYLGDLLSARRHLDHVLVHDAALSQRWQFVRFQVDPRADAHAFLARVLWLQGLPDQAMRTAESSLEDARVSNHAVSLGNALAVAACPIALWVGDLAAAERYVGMLLDHSARHGLGRWRAFGRCYQGLLVIQRGDANSGLRLLRAAFDDPTTAGSAARLFAFLISAASRHAGQIADGLPEIEDAIVRSELTEERWLIAELLRVKGEIHLWRGASGAAADAESHFRRALELARQQGALSWELRAATNLVRLGRDQGQREEAHRLLASVYDRFTEGFTTADLKAAKTLLDNSKPFEKDRGR